MKPAADEGTLVPVANARVTQFGLRNGLVHHRDHSRVQLNQARRAIPFSTLAKQPRCWNAP